MDFEITNRAADKILESAVSEGINLDSSYLRVAVVSGGCSGLTYDLGWDTTVRETDEKARVNGINVVMDIASFVYVDGSILDFTDGLEGKGFHFQNPQASRTCACGESFSV